MALAFEPFDSPRKQVNVTRVSRQTRDELRELAHAWGVTQSEALAIAVRKLLANLQRDDGARANRVRAHLSVYRVAKATGCSELVVRLYEANPDAVKRPDKRATLDRYYAALARKAKASAPPSSEPTGEK